MSALIELKEAGGKLAITREKLSKLMEKKTADGRLDWTAEDNETFKSLNEQAGKEHTEYKKWEEVDSVHKLNEEGIKALNLPRGEAPYRIDGSRDRPYREERKSIGQMVTENRNYLEMKDRNFSQGAKVELTDYGVADFKTTLSSSAGYLPFITRGPDIVPFALRRVVVQDLMPSMQISERGIEYMEETTYTPNAAPVAEGATKPESARVFTPRTAIAEVMATTLPITEQQLADAPFLMGYINATLGMEIEILEEAQLLTGTGSSPQIQGFLTKSGVQTQAKGADPVPTAFMKALTLVRFTGYSEPDAAVWHPNDWQDVVTLQDLQGRYIFGDPSTIRINQMWGVPAVVTPSETENTILVGAFRMYSYIVRRMGLRVEMGYVNDNFAKNLKTIRAETRLALVIRRPAAFCKVTGV